MSKHEPSFPLFIVGMPRSGTKLLRALLMSNTKDICIHPEAGLAAWAAANWKRYTPLEDPKNFQRFYSKLLLTPSLQIQRSRGHIISAHQWYSLCKTFDLSGVLEAFYRTSGPCASLNSRIWGDKDPFYTQHVGLLKREIPEAKFIHIVRDPRDAALSINKKEGKSLYRYTQQWADTLRKLQSDLDTINKSDFLQIRYEDLLVDPEHVVRACLEFLDILNGNMVRITLDHPAEFSHGDAAGITHIKTDNIHKYKTLLSKHAERRIIEIAGDMMKAYGYIDQAPCKIKRLPQRELLFYTINDVISRRKHVKSHTSLFTYIKRRIGFYLRKKCI